MDAITDGFRQVPAYVQELLQGPFLLPAVIILFFYLTALFINRKWAHTIRVILAILLAAGAIVAYVLKEMPLACLLAGAFIVLIVFRLLVNLIILAVQSYKNSKIERQALKKVEMRRGNRMMRSSAPELTGIKSSEDNPPSDSDAAAKDEAAEDVPLTRAQLTELTHMLRTLRDFGLLTEAEFREKTEKVYERLG